MTDLFRDRDFGSPYDNQHEYYKQNTSITAEEYQEQIRYAQSLTERILMYSDGCGEFAESFIAQNGCSAMTVSEAIEQLGSQTDTGAQITFEQEAAAATYSTWLPDGAYGQWQAAAGEYYTVTDEYVIYTAYQDDETGEIMMQEYFSYDVSQNGDVYEMYCDNGNYAFTAQYRNESLYIPFWRNGGTELYQYFKVG